MDIISNIIKYIRIPLFIFIGFLLRTIYDKFIKLKKEKENSSRTFSLFINSLNTLLDNKLIENNFRFIAVNNNIANLDNSLLYIINPSEFNDIKSNYDIGSDYIQMSNNEDSIIYNTLVLNTTKLLKFVNMNNSIENTRDELFRLAAFSVYLINNSNRLKCIEDIFINKEIDNALDEFDDYMIDQINYK